MENFKSVLFVIIFLAIVAIVGYWAFFTLEPGSLHAERQRQEELEKENEDLKEELENLKSEIRVLTLNQPTEEEVIEEVEEPTAEEPTTPSSNSQHQTLISELQKLITDKVLMKEKSRGTRVGTVQKFLNVYNGTSKRVDNDYGPGMKTDVINFQKAEGLTADGEAGPGTFQKMIDWLKKQG